MGWRPGARTSASQHAAGRMFWRLIAGLFAGVAALMAFAALLIALAFTLLTQTRSGRDFVRTELQGALNARFTGQIVLGDFHISPGLSLCAILEDVRIDSAEGLPIVRADRVELDLWLPALVGARVAVDALRVNGLEVKLIEREGMLNLIEAFQPRTSPAAKPAENRLLHDLLQRATLDLEDGAIQGRALSWTDPARSERRVQLDDFQLSIAGLLSKTRFEAKLAFSGMLQVPFARPIALKARGSGVPFNLIDLQRFEAHLGKSLIRLQGARRHADVDLILESLRLDRAELALAVPWRKLGVAKLEAAGAAQLKQGLATACLDVAIGRGTIALHAQSQLKERSIRAVLDLQALNPAEVSSSLPSGAISARIGSRWRALPDARLGQGTLALELTPSTLGQGQIDALTAEIGVAGDRIDLAELRLAMPGLQLAGSGALLLNEVGAQRAAVIDSALEIDVRSIAQSADQLSAMLGQPLPAMKGTGKIRAQVQGGIAHSAQPLAGHIEASLERFTLGALHLQSAVLKAALPDLKKPLAFQGDLQARQGQLGPIPLSALSAHLDSDGCAFAGHAAILRKTPLTLNIAGALAADLEALRLDRLVLSGPRHTWRLSQPARLDLKAGIFVDRLILSAGRQSLMLKGGIARGRLDAHIEGTALDLSAWPPWPVPGIPALGGELNLTAEVGGTPHRPTGQIRFVARDLAIGPVSALELLFHGQITDRAHIEAHLWQRDQSLQLQAALPRLWERGTSRQPLRARLAIEGVDLGRLIALLPIDMRSARRPMARPSLWPEAGKLSGHVDLAGTLEAPRAALALQAMGVALDRRIPMFDLDLAADWERTLAARCSFELDQGALDLKAHLSAPLSRAIAYLRRAQSERLLNRPLSLRARWQGLDLERFAAPWLPVRTRGHLSGELMLSGTARAPQGMLALDIRQGALRDLTGIALSLRLDLKAPSLGLQADVSIADQALMRLSGTLGCSAASLIAAGDLIRHLGNAPIDVEAELGPIGLEYLLGPSELSMGSLQASAALSGSLDLPRLALKGVLRDFWLGPQGIGVLRFEGGYADGHLSLGSKLSRLDKIPLDSVAPVVIEELDKVANETAAPSERMPRRAPNAPVLEFGGKIDAALGLSKLAGAQIDPAALQGEFSFESHAFQLSWLSGFLRSGQALSGSVDASIRARGQLDNPWAQGFLHLSGGSLALPNVERLRQLDARIDFEGRTIRIERIGAQAGKGEMALQGIAEWPASGLPLVLSAELSLTKLPLTFHGKRMGALTSTPIHIGGTLGPDEIALSLNLDKLRFDLADLSLGKDLQSLAPHKNIAIHKSRHRRADRLPTPSPLILDLSLRAQSLEVLSKDLKLGAAADLSLHRRAGELTMRGEISATEGKAELLGRSFELQSARLSWEGTPPGQAAIDATVLHENAREGVDVKITLSGVLPKPRLELTSEPPHGEQELAMLIATGRLNQRRGAGGIAAGDGAASIVGTFFADRLRRTLSSQLPLDVLQFDFGEEGISSARIEAGTYLTDDLYLGYQRDFGADPAKENVDEVRIEFQLTPTLSIESNYGYGDESRGGIGILYNKDY